MNFESTIGRVCTFFAEPNSVALCVPVPGTVRYAGEIVAVSPLTHAQPGAIPDCTVKIRGRTGREVSLPFVAHHVTLHDSWKEADAACRKPRKKP